MGSAHAPDTAPDPPVDSTTGLDRFSPIFIPKWLTDVNNAVPSHVWGRHRIETGNDIDWESVHDVLFPRFLTRHLASQEERKHQTIRAGLTFLQPPAPVIARIVPTLPLRKRVPVKATPPPPPADIEPPPRLKLPPLSPSTYAQRWIPLLQLELAARTKELKEASLYHVKLSPYELKIKVPGYGSEPISIALFNLRAPSIREGWPPIDLGDSILLRQLRPSIQSWQGCVFHASTYGINRASGLILVWCEALRNLQEDMIFNVVWRPQTRSYVDGSKAVEVLQGSMDSGGVGTRRWLFPEVGDLGGEGKLEERLVVQRWKDEGLNLEQRRAVQSVVWGGHAVPFIISGPPGTGKTKTVVEAVLQILEKHPEAHILVCGASNPSADTLAMRLRKSLNPSQLLRFNSPSRPFSEVRSELLSYCSTDESTNLFTLPPYSSLLQKRVIVTTCLDTSYLSSARCTNHDLSSLLLYTQSSISPNSKIPLASPHFSFLLIDEAGQASETDLACALAVVMTSDTLCRRAHVTICGDAKQLGPEIISEEARGEDMDVSFLERLEEREVYRLHEASRERRGEWRLGTPFVDLVRNYRSTGELLCLPSTLFYNETLEVFAPLETQNSLLRHWEGLPNPGFPLYFHGIKGTDEPVDEGASFFNDDELTILTKIVSDLIKWKGPDGTMKPLKPSEISIISPYREQVWKIRSSFRKLGLGSVDVGNVEALQGAENRVVIISTVRSNARWIPLDQKRNKGLINTPKRFNVALTRAKELMIVIGNPEILTTDPNWLAFYRFCLRNNCYTGPSILDPSITAGAENISKLEQSWRGRRGGRELTREQEFDVLVGSMARETLES